MNKIYGIAITFSFAILAIGFAAGLGLKKQALTQAHSAWLERVTYQATPFANFLTDTLNQEFTLLEQVAALLVVNPDITPEQQAKLIAHFQQKRKLNNEIALSLFSLDSQRINVIWGESAADKLNQSSSDRNKLRLALHNTEKHPNQIHLTALPKLSTDEHYVMLSLSFKQASNNVILMSLVNLSLLQTGIEYFYQPDDFNASVQLLIDKKPTDFSFKFGSERTDKVEFKRANNIGQWQVFIYPKPTFAEGVITTYADKVFYLSLIIAVVLILLIMALAFLGGKATLNLQRTTKKLKASESLKKYTQTKLESSAEHTMNGILLPRLAANINVPLSQAVSGMSSLEEVSHVFKSKLESGKITKTQLTQFIDNTAQLCQKSARHVMEANESLYNIIQICQYQDKNESERIVLKFFIEEIISMVQPQLRDQEHKFILNIPEDLKLKVKKGTLSLILSHLIINAIRHGLKRKDKGVIMLEAFKGPDAGNISLRIEDNGSGIDDRLLADLQQGRASKKAVGLKLCFQRVESELFGNLKLESKVNKYTRATLSLPRSGKAAAPVEKPAEKPAEKEPAKTD
ncbi:sensor histidine kinase [Algibacillus agarilyticus]|uniref:sensor histidine kinase n=1 Tax=Algibacillus agarilyticus TaxID=2234133 RepID=UPI000DD02BD4|nr:HAMP domain-containing sensor histidine kinase [Algibacillus agarilyticus]